MPPTSSPDPRWAPKDFELVLAGYAAWNRDDMGAWLEVVHPEVEFRTSGVWPDFDRVYRGMEGLGSS